MMKKETQLASQLPLFHNELPIIALSKPKSFNEMKEGQQEKRVYKMTEVGVIPENWEVQTLGKVSTISRLAGAEYTALWKETPSGEIISLRGFNIGQGKIIERDFVRISNNLSLKLKRSRLCKGDVVYPCVGSIGNSVVINENEKYHIQQNIARITPEPNGINPQYLAYFLMSTLAAREVERFTSSSSQPSVLVGSLRQFRIPLPPTISEQCVIAEALSDVDALLDSLDRLIAKKRDIKQAAMQQLLTGKTRLPSFDGEWEKKHLGEIGKFRNGINKAKEDFGHGYPFANLMDVFGVAKVSSSKSFGLVNSTPIERELYDLKKGDVLFVRSSVKPTGVGLTTLIKDDLPNTVFSGFLLRFRDEGQLTVEYKEHCFSETGFRDQVIASSTVSANTNINQVSLKALTIKFPSKKAEQIAIASILSDMDAEIEALIQRREKTRAIKQGMMQELLTGRTRLV